MHGSDEVVNALFMTRASFIGSDGVRPVGGGSHINYGCCAANSLGSTGHSDVRLQVANGKNMKTADYQ